MLDKLATAAIAPLGTALLLLALAAVLLAVSRGPRARRAAWLVTVSALAWLWLWSTPAASDALMATLEDRAGPRRVEDVAAADVIVVLGGSVTAARPPHRPYPDLGGASDRLWHAARLFKAGKAPSVLVSGGSWWPGLESEAAAMAQVLRDLGVPDTAILRDERSGTTAENAAYSQRLLNARGVRRAILVTSALHMQRAQRAFERAGVAVTPAPTDFLVAPGPFDPLRWVPSAAALDESGRAMKEWAGWYAGR